MSVILERFNYGHAGDYGLKLTASVPKGQAIIVEWYKKVGENFVLNHTTHHISTADNDTVVAYCFSDIDEYTDVKVKVKYVPYDNPFLVLKEEESLVLPGLGA